MMILEVKKTQTMTNDLTCSHCDKTFGNSGARGNHERNCPENAPSAERLEYLYYEHDLTLAVIAGRFGVSRYTIKRWMVHRGVAIKPQSDRLFWGRV